VNLAAVQYQPIRSDIHSAIMSVVTRGDQQNLDQNNFITALWLREYRRRSLPADQSLVKQQEQALNYLQSSSWQKVGLLNGAYGFWQPDQQPNWATGIPADIDDSAIIHSELVLAGRIQAGQCKSLVYRLFNNARILTTNEYTPPWVCAGSYYTWLPVSPAKDNIVDACVNTNAVALLACLDAKSAPGYFQACETILNAVKWARGSPARLRVITPFYPNSVEFYYALQNAVECGVTELIPALKTLAKINQKSANNDSKAICSSSFGKIVWRSSALDAIRRYPLKACYTDEVDRCVS